MRFLEYILRCCLSFRLLIYCACFQPREPCENWEILQDMALKDFSSSWWSGSMVICGFLRFRVMVGPGDRGAVGSIDRRADYGDALSGLLC
jgi:hypothetical protein